MKMIKSMHAILAVGTMMFAGAAFAGPPVAITFKNLTPTGGADASYVVTNANEVSTNTNASPKPRVQVPATQSDFYSVQNPINPSANAATVRYTIGSKTCVFATSFLTSLSGVPQWNKSASPSGGATCTANITSINSATNAWAVEFTMK